MVSHILILALLWIPFLTLPSYLPGIATGTMKTLSCNLFFALIRGNVGFIILPLQKAVEWHIDPVTIPDGGQPILSI